MKKNNILLLIFLPFLFTLFSLPNILHAQNCAQVIVNDMMLPGDAPLHGTDKLAWGSGNSGVDDKSVPYKNYKGEWYRAMTNWGQVYIPRSGNTATNTRCQIRNVISKLLRKDGTWVLVQSGNPTGAAYNEYFANDGNVDAGIKDESANGGGVSVIVGIGNWTGHNFHFWTAESLRADIDINNIVAVYTSCEARLIIDNPNKPDDRAICKNILMMGADWWLDKTTSWKPDWSANSGIASGRSKFVTTEWQTFNMCTLKPEQILANPPCGK